MTPAIRLDNICKRFGKIEANHNISLDIIKGEVLAVLGANGAGKSTLMAILTGQLQPDSGTIFLNGNSVVLQTPQQAITAGIGMVYQQPKLVASMSVSENIFLGTHQRLLQRKQMNQAVTELASRFSIDIDPQTCVNNLSKGEQHQVEILRLLYRKSDILIFDEPTSLLTPSEAVVLFRTLKHLTKMGKAIVFISHKLDEVLAVSSRVAILRKGRIIENIATSTIMSPVDLANRMIGRETHLKIDKPEMQPRQLILTVQDLTSHPLENINLELRKGEILSIVGAAGNGQKHLAQYICGFQPPPENTIHLLGMEWKQFFRSGDTPDKFSYIPEDTGGLATGQRLSLLENFLLTTKSLFSKGPWLNKKKARQKAEKLFSDFDISFSGIDLHASQLSGGNLQKLVLAREFYRKPQLIVAEHPTQGLDISASEDIWKLLVKAREEAGILLITGNLAEALTLSDRIAVLYKGRIMAVFNTNDHEKIKQLPELMAGMCSSSPP
jgi:general nucleoside transport system ATP-binding protein